jgi:hypothetical protein
MAKSNQNMANDIVGLIRAGTKKWTRTRKAEERRPASRSCRYVRMTMARGVQFKEAAAEIMPEAYAKVSGNGAYPANARQLMYAARPYIQKKTGKPLGDQYFTQILLPDYLNETGVNWDVVYDSRGHFSEPHGGRVIGLGTIEVRDYLAELHDPKIIGADFSRAKVETLGPSGSFGAVLFVEKEGFDSMLDKADIAERFDVGIMSTKGMSVTAARALADDMCAAHDIPLLILRDFDKSGFSIAGTLERDTRRYEFQNSFTRIHLGLSLADVTAMGLEFEHQHHPKGKKATMIANLYDNGASQEEVNFLFADFDKLRSTRRVELNAMTSPQFIAFVECKLTEHGVGKVIPKTDLLKQTYRQYAISHAIKTEFNESRKAIEAKAEKTLKTPRDIKQQVEAILKQHAALSWHQAVRCLIDPKSVLPPPKKPKNKDAIFEVTPLDGMPEQMRETVKKVLGAEDG